MTVATSVRRDFDDFVRSIDTTQVGDHEVALINLISEHFEELLPLGTAAGKRAKRLGEIVQQKGSTLYASLPAPTNVSPLHRTKSRRLVRLTVGPFRGFSSEEKIDLNKQYVLAYGPNGSGKTSFCEALEYAMLGNISEAEAKRIETPRYIRNVLTGKAAPPVLTAVDQDGKNEMEVERGSANRFCFIERNRIDGFARLSAAASKAQNDRIATLFGVEAFASFVSNFTEALEDKYLPSANPVDAPLQALTQAIDAQENLIARHRKDTAALPSAIAALLSDLGVDAVKSIEEVETFLSIGNSSTGRIGELEREKRGLEGCRVVDSTAVSRAKARVGELQGLCLELGQKQSLLGAQASQLGFKAIYDAVSSLSDGEQQSTCPACDTPLRDTTRNPFEHARAELHRMRELSALQERSLHLQKTINDSWRSLSIELHAVAEACRLADAPEASTWTLPFASTTSDQTASDAFTELMTQENLLARLLDAEAKIKQWNETAREAASKAETLQAEIVKLNNLRVRAEGLRTQKNGADSSLKQMEEKLTSIRADKVQLEKEHSQHQVISDTIRQYQSAYRSFRKRIGEYAGSLPSKLAAGLATSALELYNKINEQDPEPLRLACLNLPTSTDERITIRYSDDSADHDALHVLSEGNLKCLGLAILLAKALQEDVRTIIFDDVVNAIDDDHRDGIASLLIEGEQFQHRQLIITCHGEQFIRKLESKLGQSRIDRDTHRLRFLPADADMPRGVRIKEGKTSHYLAKAQAALDAHELRDSAGFCRKALENLTYELWRKVSNKLNAAITVQLRGPTQQPDLSSVVSGLIGEVQSIDPELSKALRAIKEGYANRVLNKGAHDDGVEPEADANDIRDQIKLLRVIESGVLRFGKASKVDSRREEISPGAATSR